MPFLTALAFASVVGLADPPAWDLSQYRSQAGLEAHVDGADLTVVWDGNSGQHLRARFGIMQSTPTIRELAVRSGQDDWAILGRDLVPEFTVTTGIRRTGHELPYEKRWDVFWDAPLNHPEEVRHASAGFQASRGRVKTDGARLEVAFPGLKMGSFSGQAQFTVYRGTNLVRVEAIAATQEPSVAYKYEAGLTGFATATVPQLAWHDALGKNRTSETSARETGQQNVLRARNRLAIATGPHGSIAVFPPPHQFFFARELETNLGFVWDRRDGNGQFALGVRQGDSAGGYNRVWIDRVFSLYNAPPGSQQRMAAFFYVSPGDAAACRASVLVFTHGDTFKPLAGYKTMATHFHTAFTQELLDSGSLDTTPPWIPLMRALGVNIAHIFDFHGDGHPRDPGPLRLKELETYFEGCRRHSDSEFLILPGEEANVYLGGHYNILFPRPVYWTHVRGKGQALVEDHPKFGNVYHAGSAQDLFQIMKREDAIVWQTHPRTKGSTGYPDKIRDTDYFRSNRWLGAAFKALPVDLSQKRLGEIRCFGTLDDMNNWAAPKYMVGEVDTYKKLPDYDLYGDFNINYLRLDRLPPNDDWSPITKALSDGAFFVSTGEVLIPSSSVQGTGSDRQVVADLEWTFPLDFIEAVWGDGEHVDRTIVSATDQPPFGSKQFRIPVTAESAKWVRVSAWDCAGNGAFTQPVVLK